MIPIITLEPDDNETSLDHLTFIDEREELRKCFICGAAKRFYTDNFGETRLQHSEARVRDLIQRYLVEYTIHRNIEEDTNDQVVCIVCIQKINEYDLACG